MAKLEIKLRDEVRKRLNDNEKCPYIPHFDDYNVFIDGHQPSLLTGVELSLNSQEIPEAKLSFFIDKLEVDGQFLTILKLKTDDETEIYTKDTGLSGGILPM